jgi:hypothetical protein
MYSPIARTLDELLDEALKDSNAVDCHGRGYIGRLSLGIKIIKAIKTNRVRIYNTHVGGGYYKLIEKDDLEYFRRNGWILGTFELALKNNLRKISVAESILTTTPRCKRNEKAMEELELHLAELKERFNQLIIRKRNYVINSKI